MSKPAIIQTTSRSLAIEPPEDGITAALAMLADTEGTVRVYRKRSGFPNAWAATYPASEFDIEKVAADFGGGDYFAQVCGADRMKTIQGGGSFSIDGPPKARRVQAPPSAFGGFTVPPSAGATDDPIVALSARVDALAKAMEGGGPMPAPRRDDAPTWRDMIELATRGAAQSQGASLGEMAKFLEIMRPKSNTEELLGTLTLIKKLERSGLAPPSEAEGGGLGDLAGLLNGPLAQAIASKMLADPPPKPQAVAPRVAPPLQLPAVAPTAPQVAPQPTSPSVLPDWLRDLIPAVAAGLADALAAESDLSSADIADKFAETFPLAQLRDALDTIPESVLAIAVCQGDQRLSPFALRIIMAEGALREIVNQEEEEESVPPVVTASVPPVPVPDPPAEPVAADPASNGTHKKAKKK